MITLICSIWKICASVYKLNKETIYLKENIIFKGFRLIVFFWLTYTFSLWSSAKGNLQDNLVLFHPWYLKKFFFYHQKEYLNKGFNHITLIFLFESSFFNLRNFLTALTSSTSSTIVFVTSITSGSSLLSSYITLLSTVIF